MSDAGSDARAGADPGGHWRAFAGQYALLGSPLCPCAEDVRIIEEMLADQADVFGAAAKNRAWLLGVTPAIAEAGWLQGVELVAVERVRAMIDLVWPGDSGSRRAICADWVEAPFRDQCFDLALGDGCLAAVGHADELPNLLASIHRCLRRDGYLVMRLFCRPDVAEAPDAVFAALKSGAIGSFHAFKWRLAMAVQGVATAPDVAVDAVWQTWNAARIDRQALARARGWTPAEVETMEFYRGSPARYNFMRYDDTIGRLARAGFALVARRSGSYELAERCPTVLLRKARDAA